MEGFNDIGLMCLVCHHDIPLFFANIDTPGEQQKYCIALIEHLFDLLPPSATICLFYDVGCVIHCSLKQVRYAFHIMGRHVLINLQYNIIDSSITSHLRFATTAMHAYGHEWACQLVYNPWLVMDLVCQMVRVQRGSGHISSS